MNIEKTYNVDIEKSIRYKNDIRRYVRMKSYHALRKQLVTITKSYNIIIAHNEGNIFLELADIMTLMKQTQ